MCKVFRYLFFILIVFSACSRVDSDKQIVAKWGDSYIDLDHFTQEYILFGTYSPFQDSLGLRSFYAKVMLERKIIADWGRINKLDTLQSVRETIKRRSEMAARRHLLNTIVKPEVREPDEEELFTAFHRSNTSMNTQQIYAGTRSEIDSLYHLLREGADFDRLAYNSMIKAGYRDGGNLGYLGWISFDMLDEEPENVLFSLERHMISGPVQSLKGLHIFRVHDVQQTIHFDDYTYLNARESLRHKVFQRRFDETSAKYIRSYLESHELATDMTVLRALHDQFRPYLPESGRPEELIRFNQELNFFMPEVDSETPIAWVDGNPFTVGQFIYHLPDIPYNWLNNFYEAVQVAIRDSLLAAHAYKTVQPDTARDYKLQKNIAEYSALYYASLQNVVDTLQLERLPDKYYNKWKNSQFVEFQTTDFIEYNFTDSTTAVDAVYRFLKNQDWQKTLESLPPNSFTIHHRSATTLDDLNIPIHSLQVNDPNSPASISGPYKRADWAVFKAVYRSTTYLPFNKVTDELMSLLQERRIQVAHLETLPPNFNSNDIWLNLELLDKALPYY